MEVVDKGSIPGPYNSLDLLSSEILHENIHLVPDIVGLSLPGHSSIHNGYVAILVCYFFHLVQREAIEIDSEIFEVVHVVDIAPDCVKRNIVLLVFFNDIQESISGIIAPSGLVETQRPKGREYGLANTGLLELFYQGRNIGIAQYEPEVDDPSNNFESKVLVHVVVAFDHVHGVGGFEVVDVALSLVVEGQVEGVVAVGVVAGAMVDHLVSSLVEDRPFSICFSDIG